jgi:hypothetical protein
MQEILRSSVVRALQSMMLILRFVRIVSARCYILMMMDLEIMIWWTLC